MIWDQDTLENGKIEKKRELREFAFAKKKFLLKIGSKNSKVNKNYNKPQNNIKRQKSQWAHKNK